MYTEKCVGLGLMKARNTAERKSKKKKRETMSSNAGDIYIGCGKRENLRERGVPKHGKISGR